MEDASGRGCLYARFQFDAAPCSVWNGVVHRQVSGIVQVRSRLLLQVTNSSFRHIFAAANLNWTGTT